MSLFNDDRYTWRETYFVLFDPEKRPRLSDVRRELRHVAGTLTILKDKAEHNGNLTSMTIASYEDHSALEIVYREGNNVPNEIGLLAEMLEKGCTAKEKEQLQKAKQYRAKFEILHFEQTAGTAEFKIVKMPDLQFAPREKSKTTHPFSNGNYSDKLLSTQTKRFHFDPDSYKNCLAGGIESDENVNSEDSAEFERIDPNTLVFVLEILCRLCHGIAIDPASGVII
ncbi:MAG: hypothetical protein LBF88_14270 [Planctomycetaceae bacterium]|jgi:hypothetical protein|nr:hypothetical protein [Planctomycetaceae bacterium]